MMLALTLAVLASTSVGSNANPPAVARSTDDPPIQVWLSSNNRFVRGEGARVYIRAAKDGYVVVLRADAQGRVHVLFPLDPSSDAFARGDRKFEVEGDGGHEAFTVDEGDGTGVVLAAWSESPFIFDGLVQGDQWDEHALSAQQGGDGREAALVEIVQGMAGENHFDYDVVNYTVNSVTAYNDGSNRDSVNNDDGSNNDGSNNDGSNNDSPHNDGSYYGGPYYGPYFGPAYGGWGVHGYAAFGPFCDGFYWSNWGCGPFYDPFFYPVVYRPYRYRPFVYGSFGYRTGRSGGFYRPSVIGRNRGYGFRTGTSWSSGQPRLRIPAGSGRLSNNRGFLRERTGTRSFAPGSRSSMNGRFARPSLAPRGERVGRSAPSARSAPSRGSGRGGWGSAAPRSSGGGYSRGSGGGGGGGGGRRGGGGGGGGGGRHGGGGGRR